MSDGLGVIIVDKMMWWDHIFKYGPYSATEVIKFRKNTCRGNSQDRYLSPPVRAIFEIMILPDHVLCLYPKFWKIYLVFRNLWKIYLVFSKVGGKIWGFEGYIGSNAKIVLQCLQENAMRAEVEIKTELGHFEFNWGAPQIYCQVKLSKAIKPLNINLKQIIFDKGVLAKCCNGKVKIPLD